MYQHYNIINAFFDSYHLSDARSMLKRMIKFANSGKVWNGRSPSDLLFFVEKTEELIEAVFSIVNRFDYRPEVILDKDINEDIWLLTDYEIYCSWHFECTPWHFFPRHLSEKEFLDPYRALEKFTRYRNLDKWKETVKEILFHALSPNIMDECDDGKDMLRSYIHLNKLIEAAHLIEVRGDLETNKRRRLKWKDRKKLENQAGKESQQEL